MRFTDKEFAKFVGLKIRDARIAADYSLLDLGELVGVSQQQLNKYEAGVGRVSYQFLCELSRYIDLSELINLDKSAPASASKTAVSLIKKIRKMEEPKLVLAKRILGVI